MLMHFKHAFNRAAVTPQKRDFATYCFFGLFCSICKTCAQYLGGSSHSFDVCWILNLHFTCPLTLYMKVFWRFCNLLWFATNVNVPSDRCLSGSEDDSEPMTVYFWWCMIIFVINYFSEDHSFRNVKFVYSESMLFKCCDIVKRN